MRAITVHAETTCTQVLTWFTEKLKNQRNIQLLHCFSRFIVRLSYQKYNFKLYNKFQGILS